VNPQHAYVWPELRFDLVGRTGFEPVTSSVSGKSRAVSAVGHRRTESDGELLTCGNISDYVALSTRVADCAGSHFWLSRLLFASAVGILLLALCR
jgi:hypothetical protein